MSTTWELPVVDMQDPEGLTTLVEACKEHGVFALVNHGISEDKMDEILERSKEFFGLPLDIKKSLLVDGNTVGYAPLYEQMLDTANQSKPDTKEAFLVVRDQKEDNEDGKMPKEARYLSSRTNVWPPEETLPGWKHVMSDHFDSLYKVAMRLTRMMAKGLGLDDHEFFARSCSGRMATLKLMHYTEEASSEDKGIMGAGQHTDFGIVTLLAMDQTPGLQVKINDEWRDVIARPGEFICVLGDLMQRWTNDIFRAPVHRVFTLGRERISNGFISDPNHDTEVVCLPQFCSEDNPAKYAPIMSGQHVLDLVTEASTVSDMTIQRSSN